MILVATRDDLLRARVMAVIGRARFASTIEETITVAERQHPALLLLDVRLGGNGTRAVDHVRAIRRAAPPAKVAVVTRRPTADEVREAVALGAYTYADWAAPDFEDRLRRIVVVVSARGQRIPIARLR